MKHLSLLAALALTACGPQDFTTVTAKPGETFVIEGFTDPIGGGVSSLDGMDANVRISANEACEGGTPERIAVEEIGKGRAKHLFRCV